MAGERIHAVGARCVRRMTLFSRYHVDIVDSSASDWNRPAIARRCCQAALAAALIAAEIRDVHADAPEDSSGGLETVVVTARQRVENLQDVPISVSAISGAQLANDDVTNVQELSSLAPGIQVTALNPRVTTFAIRGLGNNAASDGLSGSVGTYIDGVYLDRSGMANFYMLDLSQVEVLRGPQGTLFGKNTTAGAVTFMTRAPEFDYQAGGTLRVGDYGLQEYQAFVTGPITDPLAFRITGYFARSDGYLRDVYSGQDLLNANTDGLRGQILYKPFGEFSWRLIGEFGEENDRGGAPVLYSKGPASSANPAFLSYDAWARNLGINPIFNPDGYQNDENGRQQMTSRQYAFTSLIQGPVGSLTVNSITGWRYWRFAPQNDADGTYADVWRDAGTTDGVRQLSQEVRLTSPAGLKFQYVLGAYYFWRGLSSDTRLEYGSQFSTGMGARGNPALDNGTSNTYGKITNNSYALFGEGTWNFNPLWDVTAGIRGTYETAGGTILRSAFTGGTGAPPPQLGPYQGALSVDNLGPSARAAIDYHTSEETLLYVTISEGAKAGGFNPVVPATGAGVILPIDTLKVKPEDIANVEAGWKAEFLSRRLIVDSSTYWADVRDYQSTSLVPTTSGPVLSVTNVGSVRSRGFETEADILPDARLKLHLAVAFNDAIYLHYPNAPAVEGSISSTQDLSGRPVVEAPRWTMLAGADYTSEINQNLTAYAGGDVSVQSGYYGYIDDSPYSHIHGVTVAKLRAGVVFQKYDLSVWVDNAGDAHRFNPVIPTSTGSAGYFSVPLEPRTFGITLRASV